jgi:catechol 2,3-dioxygenase-like lactoylglutathione lyase family enzyme
MPDASLGALEPFQLRVQPMVHVPKMADGLDFYEALGGRLVFGSRDGDWSLLEFNGTTLSLLAHAPGDGRMETVELQFTSATTLEEIQKRLEATNPSWIDRGVADEAFGRMLKLLTPDGLLIKVLELERNLIE